MKSSTASVTCLLLLFVGAIGTSSAEDPVVCRGEEGGWLIPDGIVIGGSDDNTDSILYADWFDTCNFSNATTTEEVVPPVALVAEITAECLATATPVEMLECVPDAELRTEIPVGIADSDSGSLIFSRMTYQKAQTSSSPELWGQYSGPVNIVFYTPPEHLTDGGDFNRTLHNVTLKSNDPQPWDGIIADLIDVAGNLTESYVAMGQGASQDDYRANIISLMQATTEYSTTDCGHVKWAWKDDRPHNGFDEWMSNADIHLERDADWCWQENPRFHLMLDAEGYDTHGAGKYAIASAHRDNNGHTESNYNAGRDDVISQISGKAWTGSISSHSVPVPSDCDFCDGYDLMVAFVEVIPYESIEQIESDLGIE